MKRILYFFALWLAVLNGPAARAQVNWGLVAGGSLVSLYPHQTHGSEPLWEYNPGSYSLLLSGMGGVAAETPVNKHWSLDASLSYDGSGAHAVYAFNDLDAGQTSTVNLRLAYLRLPIQAIYNFYPGYEVRLVVGGGLYGALGLRGKEKGSTISSYGNSGPETGSIDSHITFTNKAPEDGLSYPSAVRPFDAGYTVMAGVQWPRFRLSPSFSQGFVNLFPGRTFEGKSKSFSLSLVYWIHAGTNR